MEWIEQNLQYAPFVPNQLAKLEKELESGMTAKRAETVYIWMKKHISNDPIENGQNYNQGDIQNKLDKIMNDESK